MADKKRKSIYIVGAAIIAVLTVFILIIFSLLCEPRYGVKMLIDNSPNGMEWSCERLVDGKTESARLEPVDDYGSVISGGHADAVKLSAKIKESDIYSPDIQMFLMNQEELGTEVFIDGELLFSNLSAGERDSNGYLILTGDEKPKDPEEEKGGYMVRVSLPSDYVGRTLSIITYYTEDSTAAYPPTMLLRGEESDNAVATVNTVEPVAVMTLCAIFTIVIAAIFLFDISNGKVNLRILLLCLFFLLLFIDKVYNSYPGTYSILTKYINLSFLSYVYTAPLLWYISLGLTSWRKYLLAGLTAVWFLYETIQMLIAQSTGGVAVPAAFGLFQLLMFVAALVLTAAEFFMRKENKIKINKFYIAIAVILTVGKTLLDMKTFNEDMGTMLSSFFTAISSGFYINLTFFVSDICATMAVIMLIAEFVKRTLKTRERVTALEERGRLTMEGYQRMVKAEKTTEAARHDMRHHILALIGMLNDNEIQRAQDYLKSLENQINELPTGRYSRNMIINVFVGAYLERAKAAGAEVRCEFSVPEKIPIPDKDLCVFLSNMLENAVKACEKTRDKDKRHISINISLNNRFLFIGCENSCPPEKEKKNDGRRHYGLENMESIAEKYNSFLMIDKKETTFSVMTNLCLPEDDKDKKQ